MCADQPQTPAAPASLSEVPLDELRHHGAELGLELPSDISKGEMLRHIRERQDLLADISRDALLDIIVWARRPVRQSATKEDLVQEITKVRKMRFDDLSRRGLVALARLRNHDVSEDSTNEEIIHKLRRGEGLGNKLRRKGRALMGSLLERMLSNSEEQAEYTFLPENQSKQERLSRTLEDEGVMSGIARKLRGAADGYIHEKLDEIEKRIDRKLDEIDKRLAEWRDREVANRIKILKITVIVSIIVAIISLGYDALRPDPRGAAAPPVPRDVQKPADDG